MFRNEKEGSGGVKNKATEAGITEFLASAELVVLPLRVSPTGSTLVASQAVRVTVLKRHLEIAAIELAVAEPGVVILVTVSIRTKTPEVGIAIASTTIAIVTAFPGAGVVTRIQRGLAQLVTAAPVGIAIPAAPAAPPIPSVVITPVPILVATITIVLITTVSVVLLAISIIRIRILRLHC